MAAIIVRYSLWRQLREEREGLLWSDLIFLFRKVYMHCKSRYNSTFLLGNLQHEVAWSSGFWNIYRSAPLIQCCNDKCVYCFCMFFYHSLCNKYI